MNMRASQFIFISLFAVVTALGCTKKEEAPQTPTTQTPSTGTAVPAAPSSTVGQKVDDATITAKVKAALLADANVKGTDINVDTTGGVVTLKGMVGSQDQINQAVRIAQSTEGVASVQNQLTVK